MFMYHNKVSGQIATVVTVEALYSDCHEAPVYRLLQCCAAGKTYLTWLTSDAQTWILQFLVCLP